MKVLEVGSSLYDWGGIERYVAYLTEGLRGRGHEVTVACPPGSPLDERVSGEKFRFALRGQFSPKNYLRYRKFFRGRSFDIIHLHFSPDFVMPALAARHAQTGKIVATRHVALKWSAGKVKRYTGLFDHIIPVSHAVEQKLAESGVPTQMMTVAKAGTPGLVAEKAPVEVRKDLGLADGEFVVGSFGRLVPEKGIEVLLKAVSATQNARALIFGEGPHRQALEDLARSLSITDRAEFKGFVPNVADAMNACDLVAVPSTWDEAFPYSVLEAMSLGRPVVASRVGGLPEIVESGITGMLFERNNDQELASVLRGLIADEGKRVTMGETAKTRHREDYTVEKMAERIEQVFLRVGDPKI